MSYSDRSTVTDKRGVTGTITTRVVEPNNVAVDVDGVTYLVPRSALNSNGEGGYSVGFSFEGLPTVPVHPAHLMITDDVKPDMDEIASAPRAGRTTVEETYVDDIPRQPNLSQAVEVEDVSIERVPIDEVVDEAPGVRQEGNVTIIPVVEEFLVVQKKLRVKEEIRVTKTKRTTPGNGAHLA